MTRTVLLGGPTASGKSEVALHLATLLPGEIICADAMQVYRGLDLATAKPTPAERARVPHHGLDLAGPGDPFSVAAWLGHARAAEQDIHARGRVAIVVGGTGLYLRAFRFGLDPMPATSPDERARLAARPLEDLVRELTARSPDAAATIDLHNRRRVERALILAEHGLSPAHRQAWHGAGSGAPLFALAREPRDLAQRIAARVDAMFAAGLSAEFDRACAAGLAPGTTAWQALGYKEVADWRAGRLTETECRAWLVQRTRQYARRQMTWLRREPGVMWRSLAPARDLREIAQELAVWLDSGSPHGTPACPATQNTTTTRP